MTPIRWLRGCIYNRPTWPRRWLWLLVASSWITLSWWSYGRVWFR